MPVDSFKFLPRLIATFYQQSEREPQLPIPWTPLAKPLSDCTFALITSGGLYVKDSQPPFDLDRERREPTWGDPSFRVIPRTVPLEQIGVSHLHLNGTNITADSNVVLPLTRFADLEAAGTIGKLAPDAYSFMGFQGFPPNTSAWEQTYAPQVIDRLRAQAVDCVLLTPT